MKKIVSLLILVIMLCSCAIADIVDCSSLSNDELMSLINAAKMELSSRTLINDGLTLYEDDNYSLYATGQYDFKQKNDGAKIQLRLEIIFENKTNETVHVFPNACIVDGWTVDISQIGDTEPHTKSRNTMTIYLPALDFPDTEKIDIIMMDLYVKGNETKNRIQLGKLYLSLKALNK